MADKNEDTPDGLEQLRTMLAGNLKVPMGEKLGFTVDLRHSLTQFSVCS